MKYGVQFNLRKANCYHHIQGFYPKLPDIKYIILSPKEFLDISLVNNFALVDKIQDAKKGDVFITKEPTHLMYYLGEQLISHHPLRKLSLVEYLNGEMISNIEYIVRSKDERD